ncbi:IS1595 family transposase [Pedobacter sp. ASV12]|uniref:IS1595 family transposase n=1 Tax=Pedobacter sp. ASV12 TaxID=2795120 RepID=UPI0018EE06D9
MYKRQDETYVGGKNKNRHAGKKVEGSQGRSAIDKKPVLGILQRDGEVRTFVVDETSSETLTNIMVENIAVGTDVITDSYNSYNGLQQTFEHTKIKHTEGNYITVGDRHTNSIEGFWSQLKRGIIGIYHNVSHKHLHRYCHEFGYRYNTRKTEDVLRFDSAIKLCDNKRLTYSQLIS